MWSEEQRRAAAEIDLRIERDHLDVVRFSFADQHGLLRGKTVVAADAPAVMRSGCGIASTLLLKDTAHRTVFPVFNAGDNALLQGLRGGADVLMVADPLSFRVLPWAPNTGWLLCDVYFADGTPVPYATRHIQRDALRRLGEAGYDFVAGLEVEFHLFKLVNPRLDPGDAGQPGAPPEVSLINKGYQYLTELRYDELDPILDILRRDLLALGLPLRSLEVEYGPSQCELTFRPGIGLEPADAMILLRSAVKQIARRHGHHATFMCRPRLAHVVSSGWHLHQSLRARGGGANAFAGEGALLSPLARHYLAGLLDHAAAATAFSTPTINGYKRYAPYSLAPDRAIWGADNRGVMVRVIGPAGDPATRLENRVGEPAANPYLYMASQILAGLDGIERELDPGPSADAPYETQAPLLPRTLPEALAALRRDACFRAGFGDAFVEYYAAIKEFRDRPLPAGSKRLGAPRIFRDVLAPGADPCVTCRSSASSTAPAISPTAASASACCGRSRNSLIFIARGREYRSEFHINPCDEVMVQLKGEMRLHYRTPEGKEEVAVISEGSAIHTPAGVPHSPRFPPDAFAMIIERKRRAGEVDRFQWYCPHCDALLHEERFIVRDYAEDPVSQAYQRFFGSDASRRCKACGKEVVSKKAVS